MKHTDILRVWKVCLNSYVEPEYARYYTQKTYYKECNDGAPEAVIETITYPPKPRVNIPKVADFIEYLLPFPPAIKSCQFQLL